MAPPIKIALAILIRFSITSILSETFAPPSMATKGRSGLVSALPRYLSSCSNKSPAAAWRTNFVMPTTDACARCAEPNASSTKIPSHRAANCRAKPSSFEEGVRGKRDSHTDHLFRDLLGAESTLVVNNNAAGLFLTLNTLAEGYEVVVSRGELVEIGGSFRVPEICAKSGCILREIGTTNRTRVSDYARALNEKTRVILRVHPSNFRMVGFTERPEIEDLGALASRHGIVLVEDLGSGCLMDLTMMGYSDE